jgi:hypothetical protein
MAHALLAVVGVTSLYGLFVFLSVTLGELAESGPEAKTAC